MDIQDKKTEQWSELGKSVYVPDDIYNTFNNL